MSQICIQVQKQEVEKLSTIVRRCIGKYRKVELSLNGHKHQLGYTDKDRCAMGAIFSEAGWDGKSNDFFASKAKADICAMMSGQVRHDIVNMNNSTTENNWAEIAGYLDSKGL
jgi:hypothetical protein